MATNLTNTRNAAPASRNEIQTIWSLLAALVSLINDYRKSRKIYKTNKSRWFYRSEKEQYIERARQDANRLWLGQ